MWPFFDFHYSFRFSCSTADLLTVVSDRIARPFNRSGESLTIALYIFNAFSRLCHAGFLQKYKFYGISFWFLCRVLSHCSIGQLWVVLDGKSLNKYPANAGVLQGFILGSLFFLLYINDPADYFIYNIAICIYCYTRVTMVLMIQNWMAYGNDCPQWKIIF